MLPPIARPDRPADSLPVKHLHSSLNKAKYPINVVLWTPEGRRLLTASSSGEFTLWNGMAFNFELIMQVSIAAVGYRLLTRQAHENAIRAACYSHAEDWLISADSEGIIKYWQPNFNNVKQWRAHEDTIRGMAFNPSDSKFVTASDDSTLKIFDFAEGSEELVLRGHQWDVRSCDWHPTKGLIVSGSKDHRVKLWESRSGKCLTTLSSSKNLVTKTVFEKTQGTLLATCGKDQIIRIFDLRMMRDVLLLRGHDSEVTSLAWHPTHRNLLSTGGQFGAIHHYLLDEQNQPPGNPVTLSPYDAPDPSTAPAQTLFPAHSVPHAHESNGPIWSMSWHPLGHILVSGSNDRATRFWSRPRPGDTSYLNDRFHIGQQAAEERGTYNRHDGRRLAREAEEMEAMDEAEGLQEQSALPAIAQLPGITASGAPALPGIALPLPAQSGLPLPPPPMPGALGPLPLPPAAAAAAAAAAGFVPPPLDPGRLKEILGSGDIEQLKAMFGGALPPLPPPGRMGFPPMPGFPPPPPGMLPPFGAANGGVANGKVDVNGGLKRPASVSYEEDTRRKQPRNR